VNDFRAGPLSVDKAFYAALKLHVYNSINDSLLNALLGGRSITITDDVKLEIARFTARRINHIFVSENGNRPNSSCEFYGFTSHKVREKLMDFEERGIIELTGKGLRDAFTYRWRAPIKHWEICSYMRFRRLTGDDLTLNLELTRVFQNVGLETFTLQDFMGFYHEAHGEEYGNTRWGKRKFESLVNSYAYQSFLKSRLEKLVSRKLVVATEKDQFALNPVAQDAVNHFDLFVNEVAYHPSREMCRACPMDALCRAGSTQLVVITLNKNQDPLPTPPTLKIE